MPQKSNWQEFFPGVLLLLALAASIATFFAITPRAFAQSGVPDAPTAVAAYSIESQKLEVRWSSSDATSTDSFKIQWKSGSEEFDSSRQLTSDPATSIESDQSTSAGDRYVDTITGLTDGTQYTVRVIAANANGDSDPSTTATGTPASEPGQVREFWENEVVKIFEGSFPWLRETWDYITTRNAPVDWAEADWEAGFHGAAIVLCNHSTPSKLRECYADAVSLSRSYPNLIYGIAHELAHVYTLANNVTATPGPLGVARLYFHVLTAGATLGGSLCTPVELFADAVVILTLGDRFVSSVSYWARCSLTTDTVTEQALAVVTSALSGQMPSWFGDTYNDSDGNPDLARVWREVKAMSEATRARGGFRATVVFQLRDAFGGYCDNQKATDSAFGSGVTRNPWRDGGCVPDAPTNSSITAAGSGKLTVSWQEPLGDGGSPLGGYKVQWKSGTQEYHSSRQVLVTDLTKIVWLQTISGLTNGESHTVRVLAYNHNGDGAAAELTATPTATDTTAPVLLLARFDSRSVRLIWNESLDESSRPEASAFTVNVNGASRRIYEVAVLGNAVWLSVEGTITTTDVLTVRYVVPTGSGATPLKDSAGNNAPAIATRAVRNDRIQIVITDPGPDKTYILGRGFGGQDSIEATATFSEPVIVIEVPELNLEIGGETRLASYNSGSGTKSLVFRYEVTEGETDSEGIWVRGSGKISKLRGPGVVRYASTKAVVPARLLSSIRTDYLVDAVRPTLVRANALANGNDVDLRWDKALDEDSAPTTTGTRFFKVEDTSDNSSRQITAISVLGKVVTLTLSTAIAATDRLTVSYEDLFRGSDVSFDNHEPLKDTLGNHARKDSAAVSITRSANRPAEFPSSETGARSVDENTLAGRNIGVPITASDADGDRRTYSISGTDAAFFEVVARSGQLLTSAALDRESRDSYSFTMSVHDGKDVHGNADTATDDTISVTVTVNDVDEAPVITGTTTIDDYDENGAGDVATYTATDPEGAATFSWSLSGPDSGDFDIAGGVLTFKNAPDYERPADSGVNNHYEVTVQASDSSNNSGQLHVDVIVNNVDEPPELTGPGNVDDFPENSATGRQVARYTANDPEGDTVTLSLSSGSDDFDLASNGMLTFKESPNFEDQSSYSVTIRAEAGSYTVDKVVTVNIENVEEPGVVTLSGVQPQEGTEFTATLEDDDEPAGTTWQWCRTSSRSSAGSAITNATSPSYTPNPDDVGSYMRVVASYDDGHGTGKSAEAVSANRVQEAPPAPEAPEFPSGGDYDRSINENMPAGRNLGAPVTAADGNNDKLTYSISASDYFQIVDSTGQLRTRSELDHEGQDEYFVTVTATDPGGLTDTVSVTITVEDVDETPEVSGSTSPEVVENGDTSVATYTATDPDREGIEWVLTGTDSEDFILNGGTLTFEEVPDFEEPADSNGDNRYHVTVEAREQGDGTSVGRLNVTITVTNADEPGVVMTNVEEPRVGQSVRLNVEDEDGGESVTEWKWERGEPNSPCGTVDSPTVTTWETISSARSNSYTPTLADRGHCIMATAFYNDRAGTGRTEQFLTPNSVEVGPFFTQDPPTFNVPENTAEGVNVGRAQARHSNSGETLTYRLGGADAGYFTIDSQTGQLRTSATPLDYETQPGVEGVVEITAEDNNGQTATINVTVAMTDDCASAGEPPCAPGRPGVSSMSTSSLKISWSTPGTPAGTSITGYELQFRESDSAGSWIREFATGTDRSHTIGNLIEGTAYEVQVRASNDNSGYGEWSESGTGTPGSTSRTTRTTRTTTETSTGGGGGGFAAFAPVNSAPSFIGGTRANRTVPENAEPGTLIGNPVTAEDTDGDELTYTLHGDDADFFTVLAGTGQLRVKAALDFEARTSYSLQVQVDDGKGGVDTVQVTVSVTDVNEAPVVTGPEMPDYAENEADAVGSYAANDPEGGDLTWSLAGDDAGVFSLSATGTLAFNMPPDYETPEDADSDNRYLLTVQATDAGGVAGALDVEVVITDDEHESIVRVYDVDRNGIIDKSEVLAAASDYFEDLITKEEAIEVLQDYFEA